MYYVTITHGFSWKSVVSPPVYHLPQYHHTLITSPESQITFEGYNNHNSASPDINNYNNAGRINNNNLSSISGERAYGKTSTSRSFSTQGGLHNFGNGNNVSNIDDSDSSDSNSNIESNVHGNSDKDSKDDLDTTNNNTVGEDDDNFQPTSNIFNVNNNDNNVNNCRRPDMSMVPYRPPTNRIMRKKRYVMYIQMQYCEGKTLKNFLEKPGRCVNYVENIRLFTQIVAGLHHVHSRGLIHRDMKPDNIFLTKDGIIKIGDFGLAKQIQEITLGVSTEGLSSSSGLSQSSSTHTAGIGTRSYVSPEQYEGRWYNEKADIYSLGIILFELFSIFGTYTERAKKMQDLRQGIIDQCIWLQYPNVAAFITRLVHHDPANRPSTADILASNFLNFYQVQPPDAELYALLQKQQEEICQLRSRLENYEQKQ